MWFFSFFSSLELFSHFRIFWGWVYWELFEFFSVFFDFVFDIFYAFIELIRSGSTAGFFLTFYKLLLYFTRQLVRFKCFGVLLYIKYFYPTIATLMFNLEQLGHRFAGFLQVIAIYIHDIYSYWVNIVVKGYRLFFDFIYDFVEIVWDFLLTTVETLVVLRDLILDLIHCFVDNFCKAFLVFFRNFRRFFFNFIDDLPLYCLLVIKAVSSFISFFCNFARILWVFF